MVMTRCSSVAQHDVTHSCRGRHTPTSLKVPTQKTAPKIACCGVFALPRNYLVMRDRTTVTHSVVWCVRAGKTAPNTDKLENTKTPTKNRGRGGGTVQEKRGGNTAQHCLRRTFHPGIAEATPKAQTVPNTKTPPKNRVLWRFGAADEIATNRRRRSNVAQRVSTQP